MLKIIYLLFITFSFVLAKHEKYDGDTLYKVNVNDVQQAKLVNELENLLAIDIWEYARPGQPGEILVPKDLKQKFQATLDAAKVQYKVEVENIKEKLDLEDELLAAAASRSNKTSGRSIGFEQIHTYEEIDAYLEELAVLYPDTVTLISGGRSFEGRDIRYLKISSTNFQDPNKPVVYMQSLLHAREWVTLPATLYAMQRLIVDILTTELDLVQDIDWIIVPIVNPDGFIVTHATERLWRKNRATAYTAGNQCLGVDLNRNFDAFFGTSSSSDVCTLTFHGRSPFSEPETRVVRDIVLENLDRLELFLDIHSTGNLILYGYGNGVHPLNRDTLHENGLLMASAIDAAKSDLTGYYRVGNLFDTLYGASGTAMDYAQVIGARMSYTYELPAFTGSGGGSGFLVDPPFIPQAAFETWQGIKTGARYALEQFRTRREASSSN